MPLVGIIDPSHNEREQDEPGRLPTWMPVTEALSRLASADPKLSPWPYELAAAAMREWQERDYVSVTMLTSGCARSRVIERREGFVLSLDDTYAALRGTLVHRTLEHVARPGAVAEVRFIADVELPGHDDPVPLSCTPDLITQDGTMWDWKVTETPPSYQYPYKQHRWQLEFNRWVVNHANKWEKDGAPVALPWQPRLFEFRTLVVVYLGPKGPKSLVVEESYDHVTPNGRTVKRRRPVVAPDEVVEADLFPRLEAMLLALESYPKWPKGLEEMPGFAGPPDWHCPGPPLCRLPNCLAKRWPDRLKW